MTAAASGEIGKLRHDPFAMLPFCGYHMGDYFQHWLNMGKQGKESSLPKIFYVNWFRKSAQGEFLWPGYSENMRVIKWILERVDGKAEAECTPIGYVPTKEAIDTSGLNLSPENIAQLVAVDRAAWFKEAEELETYFALFGDKLPKELKEELKNLKEKCI